MTELDHLGLHPDPKCPGGCGRTATECLEVEDGLDTSQPGCPQETVIDVRGRRFTAAAIEDLIIDLAEVETELGRFKAKAEPVTHALLVAVDRLGTAKAVLDEILGPTWRQGHPGYPARQSGWVKEDRYNMWQNVRRELAQPPACTPADTPETPAFGAAVELTGQGWVISRPAPNPEPVNKIWYWKGGRSWGPSLDGARLFLSPRAAKDAYEETDVGKASKLMPEQPTSDIPPLTDDLSIPAPCSRCGGSGQLSEQGRGNGDYFYVPCPGCTQAGGAE